MNFHVNNQFGRNHISFSNRNQTFNILDGIKELLRLTSPLLFAKLSVPMRGLFITWIFSCLKLSEASAGTIIYTLFTSITTFLIGVLMPSVGVLISYAIGKKNTNEAFKVLYHGIWLSLFLSFFAMLFFFNIKIFLALLGQPEELITYAVKFSNGIAWVFLPYSFIVITYKLFTNINLSKIASRFSLLGVTVSFISCYVLTFGSYGLPILGMPGVGWGLAIGYWSQALGILLYILTSKKTRIIYQCTFITWPSFKVLKQLWKLGWPMGIKYNIEFFAFFVISILISYNRPYTLIVYQCVLQIFLFISCLSTGVGIGAAAIIGQAVSSADTIKIKIYCMSSIILTILLSTIFNILFIVFRKNIASFYFGHLTENYIIFMKVIPIMVFFQLCDSFKKILSDILLAFKKSKQPLIAEFFGLWCFGLPLSCFFSALNGRLEYILSSLLGGCLISCVMLSSFYNKTLKIQYKIFESSA